MQHMNNTECTTDVPMFCVHAVCTLYITNGRSLIELNDDVMNTDHLLRCNGETD